MEPAGKRILASVTRRGWLLAAGLLAAWAGTALAVLLPAPGSVRYLAVHVVLLLAVFGLAAFGLVALAQARRRASADRELIREIQESEARFRLLADQMPADVWTTDTDLRLTTALGSLDQRLRDAGHRRPGSTLYDILGTTDPAHPAIAAHLRALGGKAATYERVEGDLELRGRVDPLLDGSGVVVGCVGVALNVAEQRAAERQSRLLADALAAASDLISVTDAENRFVYVNDAFLRSYGYAREEVLGQTPLLVEPLDHLRREILEATMQRGWTGDLVNRRKDGTEFPVSLSTSVIRDSDGGILGLLGVARDISERKRADEELRRSKERFELAVLATDEVICEWDFTTRTTWWSHSCERVLGYGPEAVRTDEAWWREKIHPDDRERVMLGWRQALGGRARHWAEEFRFRRSDGEYGVVSGVGYIVRGSAGKALRMVGALADVTFRKQAETVAGRYQAMVESSGDAILSTDLQGMVESWNPAAERLLGYSAEEMLGRHISDLEPPERAGEGTAFGRRVIAGERPPTYETIRRRRDGSLVEIAATQSPILDGEGRIIGVSAVVHDITQRNDIQRKLVASELRLRSLMEQAPVAISLSRDGLGLYANPAWLNMFGLGRPEDAVGRAVEECFAPQCREESRERTRRRRSGLPVPVEFESIGLRADGTQFPMHVAVEQVQIEDGSASLAFVTDITERKRAETALQRYAAIVESSEDAILSTDLDGVVESWNPAAERLYGYAAVEMIGRGIAVVEPPERAGEQAALRERLVRGERPPPYETTRRRRDGSLVEIATNLSPIFDGAGQLVGVSAVVRDITERKRVERELRESEEKFATAFRASPNLMAITRLADGLILDVNEGYARLLGYSRAESVGKTTTELPVWSDPADRATFTAVLEEVGQVNDFETTLRRKDGTTLTVIDSARTLELQGERCVLSVVYDITERKRAEAALVESERRFRSIGDRMRLIGLSLDTAGRIIYCNDYFTEVTGWSREELLGSDYFSRFIPPGNSALGIFEQAIATGEVEAHHRNEILTRDGLRREIEWNNTLLRDPDGSLSGIVSIGEDVTERARAEQELLRSQEELRAFAGHLQSAREEERARMARGIHDELGQMLTALRLDLAWLARRLREPTPAVKRKIAEMVAMTDETIEAGRRIVADLRPPILDDLGLVPALQWYAEHLAKRAALRIRLLTDGGEPKLDPGLAVTGYRIVQEALTNVARHAGARNAEVRVATGGGNLSIDVRDDGCGVSAAVATDPRSFGIAGMRERVRSHGGTLEISGDPGAGTLVRVVIPIERRRAAREPA